MGDIRRDEYRGQDIVYFGMLMTTCTLLIEIARAAERLPGLDVDEILNGIWVYKRCLKFKASFEKGYLNSLIVLREVHKE
jgi:hypothetical protein